MTGEGPALNVRAQRLRVGFRRGEAARELSHLELMRAWEEAMRRAGLPLSYSGTRRPTPRISIAAPLPVGVTSSCELMDVYLRERVPPQEFLRRVAPELPPGLEAASAREVGLELPALQTLVRWAEYEADIPAAGRSRREVEEAIARLLAAESLSWEHQRETKVRRYDLRPLVLGLWLEGEGDGLFRIAMRLRIDQQRAGRADQVLAALGFSEPAVRIHRRLLYVEAAQPAVQAYRRLGEPER